MGPKFSTGVLNALMSTERLGMSRSIGDLSASRARVHLTPAQLTPACRKDTMRLRIPCYHYQLGSLQARRYDHET